MEWIFILTFIFGVSDIYGIKVLTCLRLSFSHLNEHKFKRNFNDTVNASCNCAADIETIIHYHVHHQLCVQRVEL